jgi:hypothetical protein
MLVFPKEAIGVGTRLQQVVAVRSAVNFDELAVQNATVQVGPPSSNPLIVARILLGSSPCVDLDRVH